MNNEPEFIRGMVQVKKAAALANRELRVLSEDVADAIVASCDAILEEGRCMDQFPLDFFQGGAGTSVNMNTNEVVANLALELLGYKKGRYDLIHPNDHVNKSQSTNDSYPTGFRLAVFALLKELSQAIENLAAAFEAKGKEFSHVLKMGRTQLQDAVPMSLGDEFIAYATTLRHEVERIAVAGELLLKVNLGGTAIGTGINTPEGYAATACRKLAEVTGYDIEPADDLIESSSDNGAYITVHLSLIHI